MKTLHLAIIAVLAFGMTPSWAYVDLEAYLPVSGDPVTPEFKFDKTYQIDYPNGGKLKDALYGRNLTVTCFANSSSNQAVKQLMEEINTQISSSKSAVSVTNLGLFYMFSLRGTPKYAVMDHLLTLTPTITGYLLNDGHGKTPSTLDTSWMSFAINDPLVIDAKYCRYMQINPPLNTTKNIPSDMEINYPLNTIKNVLPSVYDVVSNTPGEDIFDQAFNQNLIDSTPLLQTPLDKWDSLFDPAYVLTGIAEPSISKGEKVSATAFSTGFGWNSLIPSPPNNVNTDFMADTKYHISTVARPDASGTINVQGHANANQVSGGWTFVTLQMVSSSRLGGPVMPWYETGWGWIGVAAVVVTAFFVFYFRRSKGIGT